MAQVQEPDRSEAETIDTAVGALSHLPRSVFDLSSSSALAGKIRWGDDNYRAFPGGILRWDSMEGVAPP